VNLPKGKCTPGASYILESDELMSARFQEGGFVEDPFQGKCRGMGSRGLVLLPRPVTGSGQALWSEARLIEEIVERLRAPSHVDIPQMLADLRAERDQIEEAILALERLALGRMQTVTENVSKRGSRLAGGKNKPRENPAA
jgi:hypothetical protein